MRSNNPPPQRDVKKMDAIKPTTEKNRLLVINILEDSISKADVLIEKREKKRELVDKLIKTIGCRKETKTRIKTYMERKQTDNNDVNDSEGFTLEVIYELDNGIRDAKNREAAYKLIMYKYTNPSLDTIITAKK